MYKRQAQRRAAADLLDRLPELTFEALGLGLLPDGTQAPLTYTPEAQAVYNGWAIKQEAEKRNLARGENYRAYISKQFGTFARLALIFHALDVLAAGGPSKHPNPAQVGLDSAALAGLWCNYLAQHARKLWGEGRRSDVLDAVRVLRAIERGTVRDGQKVTEVRAALAQNAGGMNSKRLTDALELLQSCGAVKMERVAPRGAKGGRPLEIIRLHPDALQVLDSVGGDV